METKMRRPKTIWITQIVIALAGVPFSFIAIFSLFRDVVFLSQGNLTPTNVVWLVGSAILRVGLVLLFIFSFWGLVKRKSYGRWLAVAVISLLTILSILGQLFRPAGPLEYYEFENSTQRMAGMFTTLIMYGLVSLLFYRLIFGESVSKFFRSNDPESSQVPSQNPPPPDVFFQEPNP